MDLKLLFSFFGVGFFSAFATDMYIKYKNSVKEIKRLDEEIFKSRKEIEREISEFYNNNPKACKVMLELLEKKFKNEDCIVQLIKHMKDKFNDLETNGMENKQSM